MQAPVIALKNVSKAFNGRPAVTGFDMAVFNGEIVALLGQTGAGKTTVLNLILGQIDATTGSVSVHGYDPYRDFYALRGKVAVSFQSDRLIPWRTARENVALGLEILRTPKTERDALATDWLNRVKLAPQHHDKYPHQLSGGMRQRVSLARALVIDPDLLLLDESFSQLDAVTSKVLRGDVLALVKQLRKTCVLITHRIEDALEMADRLIVLAPPGLIRMVMTVTETDRQDAALMATAAARISDEMAAVEFAAEGRAEAGAA
ncbi:MAG: ABC transporter ATP-binding protein [Rhodospirillales bacterium]